MDYSALEVDFTIPKNLEAELAEHVPSIAPEGRLSTEKRRVMYDTALRVRASITQCLTEMRKGAVRFWIGGAGEEVHGAAAAQAMVDFDVECRCPEGEWATSFFPHYRSDGLTTALAEFRGHQEFTRTYFRQALSKVTDPMTRGRQMVMHVADPERGIFPAQSPLGMNLPKAAGYAKARKASDLSGVTVVACGDGSTSTSDFHEACTAASLWKLPLVVMITDNEIAISVEPAEGRGIKDFAAYAKAFQGHYIECDGYDAVDTYQRTMEALRFSRDNQCLTILHCQVPRLRGHSSSDGAVFRYDLRDPLLELGEALLEEGVLESGAIMRRKENAAGHDYFDDHVLGSMMEAQRDYVRSIVQEVRAEPGPEAGDEYRFIRPDEPDVTEPLVDGTTSVQINEALNLCLHRAMDEGNTLLWGQDVAGSKGGVFKVTRGLSTKHPQHALNAPINEPLIVGTALGAAHLPGMRLLPEIQFGDYSLNTLHWLVHAGNLYWGSGGLMSANMTLRTTVDPVVGGAIYHSMSIDGFYTPIPGWVILCPSTSYDAYGLLRASVDYPGPVLFMEPKVLYRKALGPSLPGEPDGDGLRKARRGSGESLLSAEDLSELEDFRIPFGQCAVRREGDDLTIVTWGNASHQAEQAAVALAETDGIEATVIDLRSLVPWDVDAVIQSARQSGRVLIAHQDRAFSSFGREIQGTIHERLEGVTSMVVGMRNVPGVGQASELEVHTVLNSQRIEAAARDLCRRPLGAFAGNDDAWLNFSPTRRKL